MLSPGGYCSAPCKHMHAIAAPCRRPSVAPLTAVARGSAGRCTISICKKCYRRARALQAAGFGEVQCEDVCMAYTWPADTWWATLTEMPVQLRKTLAKLAAEVSRTV